MDVKLIRIIIITIIILVIFFLVTNLFYQIKDVQCLMYILLPNIHLFTASVSVCHSDNPLVIITCTYQFIEINCIYTQSVCWHFPAFIVNFFFLNKNFNSGKFLSSICASFLNPSAEECERQPHFNKIIKNESKHWKRNLDVWNNWILCLNSWNVHAKTIDILKKKNIKKKLTMLLPVWGKPFQNKNSLTTFTRIPTESLRVLN